MNYCSVFGKVQTDNKQTESDSYEPTMQHAQVGSKSRQSDFSSLSVNPYFSFLKVFPINYFLPGKFSPSHSGVYFFTIWAKPANNNGKFLIMRSDGTVLCAAWMTQGTGTSPLSPTRHGYEARGYKAKALIKSRSLDLLKARS